MDHSDYGESLPLVVKPVTISYSQLTDTGIDLTEKIEEGFGPNGLGIIAISDVPGFSALRQNLLHLSERLANLPEEVKKTLEDPESRYNFGWSHGKEKLESGKLDMLKGSYYANPIIDVPTTEDHLIQRYPAYCKPNIWPHSELPDLESAFKALGKLIFDIGLLVARHCDNYIAKTVGEHAVKNLECTLQQSRCHKGRLLYYFPSRSSMSKKEAVQISSWCGWHTDHGSLTGLTCGMFIRDGLELPCPDAAAGLYIKNRTGEIVKVIFRDCDIAYQIGEITEILSHGRLCATPHSVKAPNEEKSVGIGRATFALFMQPDWDENLEFPSDLHLHKEFIQQNGSLAFGEYSELLLNKYYQDCIKTRP